MSVTFWRDGGRTFHWEGVVPIPSALNLATASDWAAHLIGKSTITSRTLNFHLAYEWIAVIHGLISQDTERTRCQVGERDGKPRQGRKLFVDKRGRENICAGII
jgi:hypothetical protein